MPDITATAALSASRVQIPGNPTAHKPADDPKRIAEAAVQFESIMIGQLLKSMRESSTGGWLGTGDDEAGGQALDLAEEQLAENLARRGGLGLAKTIVAGLKQASAARANSTAPAALA